RDAPIKPLIEELSFIRSKTHWGAAFRFGFLRVPEPDFARIASAMGRDFAADFPMSSTPSENAPVEECGASHSTSGSHCAIVVALAHRHAGGGDGPRPYAKACGGGRWAGWGSRCSGPNGARPRT